VTQAGRNNSDASIQGSATAGKPRRRWLFIPAAIAPALVFVLVVAMNGGRSSKSASKFVTFTVRRDDLRVTVTESGSIKARHSIDIKSEVEGEVTILSIVPEGTYITEEDVKNGKVLVELDSSNLREQLAAREIDFASAEASYTQAKETYQIQVKQNESDIRAAELAAKFALMDFQKYVGESIAQQVLDKIQGDPNATVDMAALLKQIEDANAVEGSAKQKLNELKDNIYLAEGKLAQAQNELESSRRLRDANYAPDIEVRQKELSVQSYQIQLKQAQAALDLFRRYDFAKQAEQYLSDYLEAERQLQRVHAQARSKEAQARAALKSAEAEYRLRKDRLEKVKRQIEACTIHAPAPGLVVYASSGDWWRRRERPIEEGGTVYERQKIISLPDTSEMIAEIDVHESSVDKVKPGQRAKITIDAFPDMTFEGEVLKVSPLPDPQRGWLSPDLKVYSTEVSIRGRHDFLRPGMSAKVEILVEELHDVLIIPVQAVANQQGRKVCYVLTDQGPQLRQVRTGSFNEAFVQIIEGLHEGEKVLLNPPRLAAGPAAKGSEAFAEQDKSRKGPAGSTRPGPAGSEGRSTPRPTRQQASQSRPIPPRNAP